MALSLPGASFTRPSIISYQAARSEEDKLRDWIRKNNPGADIFITRKPQRDRLKEDGWEQLPFRWRDMEIWIQRKPVSDKRIGESA